MSPADRTQRHGSVAHLATEQAWFGQVRLRSHPRGLVQQAEGTEKAGTAERAAKVACLRPSTDAALEEKALNLVATGGGNREK